MSSERYVGLMSGTSLDGIDVVLADFSSTTPKLLAHHHQPFDPALRAELLALNHVGDNELHRAASASNALAHAYADCIQTLLKKRSTNAGIAVTVTAIGCHGQTVRHQPALGYTIQLVNGALLAELTGIDVICDFRSRDIAAGGHGAPLVPAFHQAVFADGKIHRVIVNIGGIANITDLPTDGKVIGFDCGPGNMLLDAWTQKHLGKDYDHDGAWARSGHAMPALLEQLQAHEYFRQSPPKSTGREMFNLAWLESLLPENAVPADVQATLLAFTANTIANAITTFCNGAQEIYVCGGGARNAALMELLKEKLDSRLLTTTDALGMNTEHVEALAFAWLAHQTIHNQPGNLPAVTGARGLRVLGAIYKK